MPMSNQEDEKNKRAVIKPARFLDPKTDVVFKKIFGQNPDLVKSFLNAILPLNEDCLIDTVEYLLPEQSPRIPSLKNTIVDVKCTDQLGRIFIVEMQLNWTTNFKNRLLFGVSKAYVQQMNKGEDYESLCPVYGLGIINDTFDPSEEWFHHYRTVNVKDSSKVLRGLELIFLELPKFKPQNFKHRKMGVLWLRFLKEINEKLVDIPEEFMENPDLSKAVELAQESGYSLVELDAYDKYWDAIQVEKTIKKDARIAGLQEGKEIGKQEGLQEGKEIGKQEGLQEGKEIGKQEGLQEGKEMGREERTKDLVRRLLAEGVDIQLISKVTGLVREEIESLQASVIS
jgi:predicted transposase/invertase (TIGR01784 family)